MTSNILCHELHGMLMGVTRSHDSKWQQQVGFAAFLARIFPWIWKMCWNLEEVGTDQKCKPPTWVCDGPPQKNLGKSLWFRHGKLTKFLACQDKWTIQLDECHLSNDVRNDSNPQLRGGRPVSQPQVWVWLPDGKTTWGYLGREISPQ